jgi:hypothetical protein
MDDASSEEIETIHQGWQEAWGFDRVAATDIIQRIKDGLPKDATNQLLVMIRAECFGDAKGNPTMKLGKMLGKHRGRWVGDKRLVKARSGKARFWQLEKRAPRDLSNLFSGEER